MSRLKHQEAYPGISFRPRTTNWFARLIRMPAECVHLEGKPQWMATFLPDNLFLQGKNWPLRQPSRPEVSLCRDCLTQLLESELSRYAGRVVAFEPDGESVTQYFFVAAPDFEEAGLQPEVAEAIGGRLARDGNECKECARPARWLWFSREQVESLDATDRIARAEGENYCAAHGTKRLCRALAAIPEVNLFYVNAPYGEGGAYLWI
jgi:hypothetical protein